MSQARDRPLQLNVTFSSKWMTHGISYAAEVHRGFLLWGSAPARSHKPLMMRPVVPGDFDVVSQVASGRETVITAVVSGKTVTVVIPDVVAGAQSWPGDA